MAPQHRTHAVYGTFGNPTTKWPSDMPRAAGRLPPGDRHPPERRLGPPSCLRHRGRHGPGGEAGGEILPRSRNAFAAESSASATSATRTSCRASRSGRKSRRGRRSARRAWAFGTCTSRSGRRRAGRRVMLNPLRPGGKLAPVKDTGNPFVREMRVYAKADENSPTPRALPPDRVRGVVVPVALAMDSFPFREWPGAPTVPLHVYRASIELRRGQTTVLARTLFQLDMAPGPTWQHFSARSPAEARPSPSASCASRRTARAAMDPALGARVGHEKSAQRLVHAEAHRRGHRRAECQQDPAAPGRELIQTLFATMTSIDSAVWFPTMSQAVTVNR